jgi:histidinol phosphatase-like PHP family hydrolase
VILGSQDLHVHTTFSDGDLPLEEVVSLAAGRGVQVGIADHVSFRTPDRMISSLEAVQRYLQALEAAPVLVAGEFCWCDRMYAELPPEVLSRFDYRIGSNHGFALPDGTWASPWWKTLPGVWADRPEEVMEIMIHNLCDMVRTMDVQIAAHLTLTPPALLSLEADPLAWWTPAREDRIVEALAETGVALEISSRYRLPHDRLLRKAKQAGARFSLGSDAHHRGQVGNLDWAVRAAETAGITDADLFIPEMSLR